MYMKAVLILFTKFNQQGNFIFNSFKVPKFAIETINHLNTHRKIRWKNPSQ